MDRQTDEKQDLSDECHALCLNCLWQHVIFSGDFSSLGPIFMLTNETQLNFFVFVARFFQCLVILQWGNSCDVCTYWSVLNENICDLSTANSKFLLISLTALSLLRTPMHPKFSWIHSSQHQEGSRDDKEKLNVIFMKSDWQDRTTVGWRPFLVFCLFTP